MSVAFSKHRKFKIKPILCLILALEILCSGCLCVSAKNMERFDISLEYGFEGEIKNQRTIPVKVTIKNTGKDFDGFVQLILPPSIAYHDKGATMYEQPLSISAGTSKTIFFTFMATKDINAMNVRIVTKDEKVLASEYQTLSPVLETSHLNIGVLCDDFSALSYMNGLSLFNNRQSTPVTSLLYEYTADSFPEDASFLEMVDLLIITNFSTDSLSSLQLSAIDDWVKNGGTILIGTGSHAGKTLSGLKTLPAFTETNIDTSYTFETHKTLYGLSICNPDLYTCNYPSVNNEYADILYERFLSLPLSVRDAFFARLNTFIEKNNGQFNLENSFNFPIDSDSLIMIWNDSDRFLMENLEFFRNNFVSVFSIDFESNRKFNLEVFGEETLEDEDVYTAKKLSSLVGTLCRLIVPQVLSGSDVYPSKKDFSDLTPVSAEIAKFTPPDDSTLSYWGDDSDTNLSFLLGFCCNYIYGRVFITCIDFSQNPLVGFDGKKDVASVIIKKALGQTTLQNIADYFGNVTTSTSVKDYAEQFAPLYTFLKTAPIPPLFLCIIILAVYLVAIPVTYKLLKKKKKAIYFWSFQIALTFVFSLVMLISCTRTKISKSEFRTITINTYSSEELLIQDISSYIMPKKKKYSLSLNHDRLLYRVLPMNNFYYFDSAGHGQSPQLDSYYVGIKEGSRNTDYTFNNTTGFSSEHFIGTASYASTQPGFSLSYNPDTEEIFVTNNTGKDLKKAYLILGGFYPLDTFKSGETKVLDKQSPCFINYTQTSPIHVFSNGFRKRSSIYSYLVGENTYSFRELFEGVASEEYLERRIHLALYEWLLTTPWIHDIHIVGGVTDTVPTAGLQSGENVTDFSFEYCLQGFYQLDGETFEPLSTGYFYN